MENLANYLTDTDTDIGPPLSKLAASKPGLIYIPAGRYQCSAFRGAPSGTVIARDGPSTVIEIADLTHANWRFDEVDTIEVRDLTFDCRKAPALPVPSPADPKAWWESWDRGCGVALALNGGIGHTIQDVRVIGAEIRAIRPVVASFTRLRVEGPHNGPCIGLERAWACTVRDCFAWGASSVDPEVAIGISIAASTNVQVIGNHVWDNGGNGIDLAGCQYCTVALNHVYESGHEGIALDCFTVSNSDNSILDNRLINNKRTGLWIGGGIKDKGHPADRLMVRGNTIQGSEYPYMLGLIGADCLFVDNIPPIIVARGSGAMP